MVKCRECKREFGTAQALNSHWGLKHGPNKREKYPSGKDHPKYGKKGSNQYAIPLLEREFDALAPPSKKKYLIEERGHKCEECGFQGIYRRNGSSIIQMHHKDGNRKNNIKANLELLCPNCHALTDNFGFNGKTHSEAYRKQISKNNKLRAFSSVG